MPKFPKNTVKPEIVTGVEALGRGQDLNKLATFLQYLQPLGQQIIAQEMNIGDYIDRLGASLGIDTSGLIKTSEEKQMEKQMIEQQRQQMMQQQMMQDVVKGSAPPLAKTIAQDVAGNPEMLEQMQQQLQQTQNQNA